MKITLLVSTIAWWCILSAVIISSVALVIAAAHQGDAKNVEIEKGRPPTDEFPYEHHCVHDTHIVPAMLKDPPTVGFANYIDGVTRGEAHPLAVGGLRIVMRTPDLTTAGRFCSVAGATVPDYQGGNVVCTTDTLLTSAKLTLLTTKILPAAFAIIAAAINVNQVLTTIKPSSTSVCGPFTIAATDTTTGVSSADLVLYIAAAPTTGSTVAWAGPCQVDTNRRPIVGKMNFSPKYLAGNYDTDETYRNFIVKTAVHEIIHAMGFSAGMFYSNFGTGGYQLVQSVSSRRGRTASEVNSTNAVAAAKAHFGCSTLTGVELEDQGGSGTAGSHWERRILHGEIMTGISSATNVFSTITMGLLQDTGFYFPVTSQAGTLTFGKDAGCTFITDKCGLTTGGMGTYFCQAAGEGCTYDNKSIGSCSYKTHASDISPAYYQYFSDPKVGGSANDLMDYCPIVAGYSNFQCDSTSRVADSSELVLGFSFGTNSRCVKTTNFLQNGFTSTAGPYRCMTMNCNAAGYLQLTIPNVASLVNCPLNGAAGTINAPTGYAGTIDCPDYASFCTGTVTLSPTSATSTTTTTITKTSTTTTTLSPGETTATTTSTKIDPGYTLKLTGGYALRSLYADRNTQFLSALKQDIAYVLGIDQSLVTVSASLGNESISVANTVVYVSATVLPQNMMALVDDATLLATINQTPPAWMKQTQALHLLIGSASVTVASVTSATSKDGLLQDDSCSHGCRIFITACVLCGAGLILCIYYTVSAVLEACVGEGDYDPDAAEEGGEDDGVYGDEDPNQQDQNDAFGNGPMKKQHHVSQQQQQQQHQPHPNEPAFSPEHTTAEGGGNVASNEPIASASKSGGGSGVTSPSKSVGPPQYEGESKPEGLVASPPGVPSVPKPPRY